MGFFQGKTHKRRTCPHCMSYGLRVGCMLPFRQLINFRHIANLEKKTIRQVRKELQT